MDVETELERFLAEDLGAGDITTGPVLGERRIRCVIVSRGRCVLAGAREAAMLFRMGGCTVSSLKREGACIAPGGRVMAVSGPASEVLSRERTALNIMSRMSGIATATAEMVRRVHRVNPRVLVACTRKTTPGFRWFEKMAVAVGGGWPHRYRLDHAVMVKDNHIAAAGGVGKALAALSPRRRRGRIGGIPHYDELYPDGTLELAGLVEAEAETVEEAVEAALGGADIVMLDNMDPGTAASAARAVRRVRPGTLIECSGGIGVENAERYARFADIISSGRLTMGAPPADFSMEMAGQPRRAR